MIRKRLTAPFEMVSIHDDNLYQIPHERLREYIIKRDIDILGDLSQHKEPITVFKCKPLMVNYESERDRMAEIEQVAPAAWQIFKAHVISAHNCINPEDGESLLTWTDEQPRVIENDCRKNIPPKIVIEIAHIVCEKANNSTAPFTVPAQYWEILARYQMRRARDADTEEQKNASPTST